MRTQTSETAGEPEQASAAEEFGRTWGETAALNEHVVDVYLESRAAAIAEGFSTVLAIVAATNAATTLKDRQEADK